MQAVDSESIALPASSCADRRTLFLGALASLILMVMFLGTPPVQRTQEARVLETAREMLGKPWKEWMIPHLNGELRTEKPPLAYWLAAGAFKIGGVSEGVARIPFALAGWVTVLLIFVVTDRMSGRRAGLLAAAALMGTMMFAHLARLAETDILATCFITAAMACIIWGVRRDGEGRARLLPSHAGRLSAQNCYRLSGIMIGMVILAKGLPFIFVIVFLIGIALAQWDWRMLWRWTLSGAPILAAAVGLPWYIYIDRTVGLATIRREAAIGMAGMEHTGSFLQYFPDLLRAVAPWSALVVLAIILGIAVWKARPPIRVPLVWFGAVFIPLLLDQQRQPHYLLPALPPLAILSGWLLDQAIERKLLQWKLIIALLLGTIAVVLLLCAGLPMIAHQMRGQLLPADFIFAAAGTIAMAGCFIVTLRSILRGAIAFALVIVIGLTLLTQVWLPSLRPMNPRAIAAQIRTIGDGPYCFYGQNISLPVVFYLKQTAPVISTPAELSREAKNTPGLIVIAQNKSGIAPPPLPPDFEKMTQLTSDDQTLSVYRVRE